jgi:hypothetical protein
VRAYFRISQAMGKVDRAVSLGGPWSGEGGFLDAKNTNNDSTTAYVQVNIT